MVSTQDATFVQNSKKVTSFPDNMIRRCLLMKADDEKSHCCDTRKNNVTRGKEKLFQFKERCKIMCFI